MRPEQVLASRLMPELTAAREKQLGELVRTARLTGEVPTIGAVAGINPSSEPLLIRGRLAWAAAIEAAIPRVAVDLIRDDGAYQLVGEAIKLADSNNSPLELAHRLASIKAMLPKTSHQDLADITGMSRNSAAYLLLILNLPGPVHRYVANGKLSIGHARALCSGTLTDDQRVQLAREAAQQQWSVREIEKATQGARKPATSPDDLITDPNLDRLETEIQETTGLRAMFEHRRSGRGRLIFEYDDIDHIENLLRHLPIRR